MNAHERLLQSLDEKDEKIEELEGKLYDLEEDVESRSAWSRHREEHSDEGLPVPRLEIVWSESKYHGHDWEGWYFLVKYHLLGHIVKVPLGMTKVGGYGPGELRDGKVYTPFRDGAHIKFDMIELGLPAYARLGDNVTELQVSEHSAKQHAKVHSAEGPADQ